MKKIVFSIIVLTLLGFRSDKKTNHMEQANIIEMVLWEFKEGVSVEEGKASVQKLNAFVRQQPGFISRKTALSKDGKFLDVVLWTDLESAQTASEKAMQNEMTTTIFSTMDQEGMLFQHFEIFNRLTK